MLPPVHTSLLTRSAPIPHGHRPTALSGQPCCLHPCTPALPLPTSLPPTTPSTFCSYPSLLWFPWSLLPPTLEPRCRTAGTGGLCGHPELLSSCIRPGACLTPLPQHLRDALEGGEPESFSSSALVAFSHSCIILFPIKPARPPPPIPSRRGWGDKGKMGLEGLIISWLEGHTFRPEMSCDDICRQGDGYCLQQKGGLPASRSPPLPRPCHAALGRRVYLCPREPRHPKSACFQAGERLTRLQSGAGVLPSHAQLFQRRAP